MNSLTPKLIENLKKLAAYTTWEEADDFNPYDLSGGNFDDAYYGGERDGQTNLAREILGELGIDVE